HLFNLADDLRERVSIGLWRNLERIVNEVRETKELYELLMKSRNETLTPEEKRKVRDQLTDIMKTIPAVAIFALPGGGLALPVLIKLLPFNLLPSSFED
ncbi:MAG: LETM1 domain-containing protein, partial [SAR324 cluster bacterium]|nr:LETM1 domain-containing protein [SAR324 cluster bacterium]